MSRAGAGGGRKGGPRAISFYVSTCGQTGAGEPSRSGRGRGLGSASLHQGHVQPEPVFRQGPFSALGVADRGQYLPEPDSARKATPGSAPGRLERGRGDRGGTSGRGAQRTRRL